ncbi:hypothetical protein PYCC9005_006054 [Savitreella phatthalungensis]
MFTPAGALSRDARKQRARPRVDGAWQPAAPITGPLSFSYGSPLDTDESLMISEAESTLPLTARLQRRPQQVTNEAPLGVDTPPDGLFATSQEASPLAFRSRTSNRSRRIDNLAEREASRSRRQSLRSSRARKTLNAASVDPALADTASIASDVNDSSEDDALLAQLDYTSKVSQWDETSHDQPQCDEDIANASRNTSRRPLLVAGLLKLLILQRLLLDTFRRTNRLVVFLVPVMLCALAGAHWLRNTPAIDQQTSFRAGSQTPQTVEDYVTRLLAAESYLEAFSRESLQADRQLRQLDSELRVLKADIADVRISFGSQEAKTADLEQRLRDTETRQMKDFVALLDQQLPERLVVRRDPVTGALAVPEDFWRLAAQSLTWQDLQKPSEAWATFVRVNKDALAKFVQLEIYNATLTKESFLELIRHEVDTIRQECKKHAGAGPQNDEIATLIDMVMRHQSDDRPNAPDFASYAAGARINPHLTSQSYDRQPATAIGRMLSSLLSGVGRRRSKPPAVALYTTSALGMCWAFAGEEGQLAVRLSEPILLDRIAIEHMEVVATPDIASAPREIEVWARPLNVNPYNDLSNEPITIADEQNRVPPAPSFMHVLDMTFNPYGRGARQVVRVPAVFSRLQIPVDELVFRIRSNWGHKDYTCLYRVSALGSSMSTADNSMLEGDK